MTKQELWAIYTAKNPGFAKGGTITMSADGLKKLFDQTWDMAVKSVPIKSADPYGIFNEVFGKR